MDTQKVMRGLYQTNVCVCVCPTKGMSNVSEVCVCVCVSDQRNVQCVRGVCVCVCVRPKECLEIPLCVFLKWHNPAQDGRARPCLTAKYLCPCARSYFFFFRKKLSKFLSNPFKFWPQKLLILVSQKPLNNTAFTPK